MALEYLMRMRCDRCGDEIEPLTQVKSTHINPTRWAWFDKWKSKGVMIGLPNMRGKYSSFALGMRCAQRITDALLSNTK